MMASHDELVRTLKATGMTVDTFIVECQGAFTEADADWNYKDVAHHFHVHGGIRPILGIVEHDKNVFINLKKVLGYWLPRSVVSYHAPLDPETSFTTWLFYALVTSTRFAQTNADTCRIETTHSVCAPKLLAWSLPFVRRLINRNYRLLMEGDIPMRERRVELRRRGYRFARSGERHSFLESLKISSSNVVFPAQAAPFNAVMVDLETDLPPGAEILLGDNGHLGLRLIRQGDRIFAFARMCTHEGALLDGQTCMNGFLKCPCHGRMHAPIVELNAREPEREECQTDAYRLTREGSVLSIEPCGDATRRGYAGNGAR